MSFVTGGEIGPGKGLRYDYDAIRRVRNDKHSSGTYFLVSAQLASWCRTTQLQSPLIKVMVAPGLPIDYAPAATHAQPHLFTVIQIRLHTPDKGGEPCSTCSFKPAASSHRPGSAIGM